MPIGFRKSVKIAPGVRINISKKGIGTSVGVKGAHFSNGPSGKRVTTSMPGTGIKYTKQLGHRRRSSGCLGVLCLVLLFLPLLVILLTIA